MLLRELRSAFTVTPGQKIRYVTDVADTGLPIEQAIIRLAHNADLLFIEAAFAEADAVLAAEARAFDDDRRRIDRAPGRRPPGSNHFIFLRDIAGKRNAC